ncbi:MAG: aldose 1-epimerase [Pseudomonadota bacterium]
MSETSEITTLRHDAYELELCPIGGGCITAFRYRGQDVMRRATQNYWANYDPREAGSFPLVPYSNRIAEGRFTYNGRTYQLPLNMPPEPHAIHGDGWQGHWSIEETTSSDVVLAFESKNSPIGHRSHQIFRLDDKGLLVTLEITNTGAHALPFGFGHHPYFPKSEGLTLETAVSGVWMPDERMIPKDRVSLPDAWNFNQPKRLAALELDNCFTEFMGLATMRWPETNLTLTIDTDPIFGHLVVFVPPGKDFVCVEPVSNVNDGVHQLVNGRVDTGLKVLQPGESLMGSMRFSAAAA